MMKKILLGVVLVCSALFFMISKTRDLYKEWNAVDRGVRERYVELAWNLADNDFKLKKLKKPLVSVKRSRCKTVDGRKVCVGVRRPMIKRRILSVAESKELEAMSQVSEAFLNGMKKLEDENPGFENLEIPNRSRRRGYLALVRSLKELQSRRAQEKAKKADASQNKISQFKTAEEYYLKDIYKLEAEHPLLEEIGAIESKRR